MRTIRFGRVPAFRHIAAVCAFALATLGARPAHAAATGDWPSFNNDLASNRYAVQSALAKANVAKLHPVCSAQLGMQAPFQTGPIVVGGTIYATTLAQTFAIDGATCRILWTNRYALPQGDGGTNRGAAYASGRIFRGLANGHVIALDAKSGKTLWDRSVVASGSLESVSAAPIVYGNTLIVGTAGAELGQACHVLALDQLTGKTLYSFRTVPNPPAKDWRGATRIAGGSTWTSYSIDAATAHLYVPAGNPGPDFDTRLRGGANSLTNSLLEFDAKTGALRRSLQLVSADEHDWDVSTAPAIVTLKSGAKIVLSANKDGYLRAIDVTTFRESWKTPVTTISNAAAPIAVAGTHFCPGTKGGVVWNGAAYSPLTGLAYVNAVDWCSTLDLTPTPQPYVAGKPWLGTTNSFGTSDASATGWVYAVDATSGAVRWRYHAQTPLVSGITATAGGLVLSADLSGKLFAFDAATGAVLATVPLGLPVGGGIVSYAIGPKQYVAVAAGMSSGGWRTPKVASAIVVLGL